jgi:hypothetical protein
MRYFLETNYHQLWDLEILIWTSKSTKPSIPGFERKYCLHALRVYLFEYHTIFGAP